MKINLTCDEFERLDMLVSYYDHHGIDKILDHNPGFVHDDMKEILEILKKVLEV